MNEDTIRQDVYAVLHDLLKNNIVEVDGRVYSSYPMTNVVLPLLIVEPAQVKTINFLSTYGYSVNVQVSVYTKKNVDVDVIADEIMKVFRNNQQTFWNNQMYLLENYDSNTSDFVDLNNTSGHYKMLSFVFRVLK